MKMVDSSKLSYVFVLVIHLLLTQQTLSQNTTVSQPADRSTGSNASLSPVSDLVPSRSSPNHSDPSNSPSSINHTVPSINLAELDTRNETLNNEIGDNPLPQKYGVSKELKYYLKAFNDDDHLKNNKSIQPAPGVPSSPGNSSISKEHSSLSNSSMSSNPSKSEGASLNGADNSTRTNEPTNEPSGSTTETPFGHLLKSMCALTNNQVEGCDRYECNRNTCYCNEAYDLTINLKSSWPIKYMCLKKRNYNDECLVDEQCSGKHQVCLNKKNFRNYVNHDLDYSEINDRLERLVKTVNNTADLNRQIFIEQMAVLYNQTKLSEYSGKCRCRLGYFFNYYLSYARNRHFSKQIQSFLVENNSSDVNELFAKQKNLFAGHCLKVRALSEACELNSECQMNDPSSVCRKKKCACKYGFQMEKRNQNNLNETTSQSTSVLIGKLTNSSTPTNVTRLICEPVPNLSLELGHNRLLEKQVALKNNTPIYHPSSRSGNPQLAKDLLLKNCSDEVVICDGRHNCVKKSKRLQVQENFASLGE